jgi:hypothetical protein
MKLWQNTGMFETALFSRILALFRVFLSQMISLLRMLFEKEIVKLLEHLKLLALFRSKIFLDFDIVFSFVFDSYCLTMD